MTNRFTQKAQNTLNNALHLAQKMGQVIEMQVLDALVFTVIDQQTAVIAGLHRRLGNQLLRKIVIKISSFHTHNLSFRVGSGG